MEHTPTPWYALSGGFISTSVVADWASKEKYIGMAATEKDAQNICLAHNAATSSANEKSNDEGEKIVRAVNGYEALARQNEAMREALEHLLKAEPMQQGERNGYIMGVTSQAIDKARKALQS